MAAEYTANVKKLWGQGADRGFARVPYYLLWYHTKLGITKDELTVICWIIHHQRSQKPAFPHPNKTAEMLGYSLVRTTAILKSLEAKGFIHLNATKNGSGNFHQDLKPLMSKLNEIVASQTSDGSTSKKKIKKDASIPKNASIQKDASIPHYADRRDSRTVPIGKLFRKHLDNKKKRDSNGQG